MAKYLAPSERQNNLVAKVINEFKRLVIMFLYLWVILGLYVLDETVILAKQNIDFQAQGFAAINALILAKVMLVAEDLGLGARFKDRPLIYPILYKSITFAILFIVFYICEGTIIGLLHGKAAVASVPHLGGGTFKGLLCVAAIMFISLLPFFAFREIGRVIGEDELWNLLLRRGGKTFILQTASPQQPKAAGPGAG
jgi:hypothetical protein